ncbi:TPA: hypothetical protein R3U69_002672 [Escherichia coli]|nr:hypothetical protein [Escherichia coli]HEC5174924.1 hypothetical protein [Escherichia coli]
MKHQRNSHGDARLLRRLLLPVVACGVMAVSGCDRITTEEMTRGDMPVKEQVRVVNTQKVFEVSQAAEAGRQHLEKVRERLQAGAEKIREVYGPEGSHPSEQVLREGEMRLEQQFRVETEAVNAEVARVLQLTTQAWAEAHPGAVVLPGTQVLGADSRTDITDEIVTEMAKQEVKFASLPEVTVAPPEKKAERKAGKKTETEKKPARKREQKAES